MVISRNFSFIAHCLGVGTIMTPAKGSHAVGMAMHQICSAKIVQTGGGWKYQPH